MQNLKVVALTATALANASLHTPLLTPKKRNGSSFSLRSGNLPETVAYGFDEIGLTIGNTLFFESELDAHSLTLVLPEAAIAPAAQAIELWRGGTNLVQLEKVIGAIFTARGDGMYTATLDFGGFIQALKLVAGLNHRMWPANVRIEGVNEHVWFAAVRELSLETAGMQHMNTVLMQSRSA